MKKALNTYCSLLILSCTLLMIKDNQDIIMWCYNLGKGSINIDFSDSWKIVNVFLWGLKNTFTVLSGIFIILITVRINQSVVFDWKNTRMFRLTGIMLAAYFFISTIKNAVEIFHINQSSGNPVDYHALVATSFVLMVGEIFAIGLRLKEENELTI